MCRASLLANMMAGSHSERGTGECIIFFQAATPKGAARVRVGVNLRGSDGLHSQAKYVPSAGMRD